MAKGNIVRWITVKGRRIPIYEDGSMGGFMEGKKSSQEGKYKNDFQNKADEYREKFLTKRSDEEIEDIKKNLDKSTAIVGTTEDDHVAYKAIEDEQKRRYSDEHRSKTGPLHIMTDDQVMEAALQGDRNALDEMSKRGLSTTKDLREYRNRQKGSKPSLDDIKGYGYDPHDATGDPTIITADGRSYYKVGDDKWVAHSDSGRTLSGSISDKQMAERLSNAKDVKVNPAAKPNKSIKIGDKEVAVKKDKSMDDIFENRTTTRGTTPGMINTMSNTALRTQLRKAGLSSADMKGKDIEELRRMLLAIYKKK